MPFTLGQPVPLTVTITDENGIPINASTVTLTITLPDGTTATPSPSNTATGVYECDYLPVTPGRYLVDWNSTVPLSSFEDVFDVRSNAPSIVSLSDMKRHLGFTGPTRDEEIRGYIESATGVIERHLGQAVVRQARTEEHVLRPHQKLVLIWGPVVAVTALATVDGTYTWDVSTLHSTPAGVVTAPLGAEPYGHVTVTYTAGMAHIPAEYILAAQVIVQHLWQLKRPDKGAGNRNGALQDSMGYQQSGFSIPNRALELLGGGMPGIA